MHISELIGVDRIIPRLRAGSKMEVLRSVARRAAELVGLDERAVLDALLTREIEDTTGIGAGVAIPHCHLAELDRSYGFFARLEVPVDFDAADGKPVDLVFLLMVRENGGPDYLDTLARVLRIFRAEATRRTLRGQTTASDILDILFAASSGGADSREDM